MNKTPKSKVYPHLFIDTDNKSEVDRVWEEMTGLKPTVPTDIISRMEAAQARFAPTKAQMAEEIDEQRAQYDALQLTDTPPEPERAFDGEDVEEWQRRSEEQGAE